MYIQSVLFPFLLTTQQITDEIESVEGVKLLNVDPGKATNRTVVTFVGMFWEEALITFPNFFRVTSGCF